MEKVMRRDLFRYAPIATSLAAAQTTPAPTAIDWNAVREDFPWLKRRLWLTAADYHPISRRSIEAMERHIRYRGYGEGSGSSPFSSQ